MSGVGVFLASDLKLRWRSLMWWVIGVIALVAISDAFYPSIAGDPSLNAVMEQIPDSLRPLLGPEDITSPVGYLASQLYLSLLPALLLVFAIGRGVALLAGEEEDHTLDLLLAQPISRASLYVQKFLGLAIGIALLSLASWIPTAILAEPTGLDISATSLAAATLQLFALATFFGALAMAVSSAVGRKGLGIAVAAGVAFGTFLIDGLGQSIDWLADLRPLMPWRWYDVTTALTQGFVWTSFLVLLGSSLILAAIGFLAFGRRNLRA
jgi:ABC-2 type transport system permease protein